MQKVGKLFATLVCATAVLVLFPQANAAIMVESASTEALPDLKALRPIDISITTTSSGQRQLRFSSRVANAGAGPFQLQGSRGSTSDPDMTTVTQQIINTDGTLSRNVTTAASMYFAGDGHTHWHVRDLETYELVRTDNGVKVGTGEKHGFCFFDIAKYNLSLPGAPQSPVYKACGGASDLSVTMGLSVGWADRYGYKLPDQYIDITGLAAGRYRLIYTADAQDWFIESSPNNNRSCVTLQLDRSSAKVVDYRCTG
jgi:Lysyl oxidase